MSNSSPSRTPLSAELSSSSTPISTTAPIIGIVFAILTFLAVVVAVFFALRMRRRRQQQLEQQRHYYNRPNAALSSSPTVAGSRSSWIPRGRFLSSSHPASRITPFGSIGSEAELRRAATSISPTPTAGYGGPYQSPIPQPNPSLPNLRSDMRLAVRRPDGAWEFTDHHNPPPTGTLSPTSPTSFGTCRSTIKDPSSPVAPAEEIQVDYPPPPAYAGEHEGEHESESEHESEGGHESEGAHESESERESEVGHESRSEHEFESEHESESEHEFQHGRESEIRRGSQPEFEPAIASPEADIADFNHSELYYINDIDSEQRVRGDPGSVVNVFRRDSRSQRHHPVFGEPADAV